MTRLVFGGVPLWLMRTYLSDLGASVLDDTTFAFADAEVVVAEMAPHRVGQLSVGRLAVQVQADTALREAALVAAIRLKALRGGG